MRKTKSDPIQFRLSLDDYAILEQIALEAEQTPKDYVIDLTLKKVASARRAMARNRAHEHDAVSPSRAAPSKAPASNSKTAAR